MRRLWGFVRRYSTTLAWTVNIVVVFLLFLGIVETQHRVEREGLERDFKLCLNTNEIRAGFVDFVGQIIPADADPRFQEIIDLARESFAPKPCPPDPTP